MNNDRYLSINELPYIQQLARQIQYNMYASPYQNNNQALQYVREVAKIMEAQRGQRANSQLSIPILKDIFKQGYQQGVDLIPYRNTEFSTPTFFRTEPVRGPQTYSTSFSG